MVSLNAVMPPDNPYKVNEALESSQLITICRPQITSSYYVQLVLQNRIYLMDTRFAVFKPHQLYDYVHINKDNTELCILMFEILRCNNLRAGVIEIYGCIMH